MNRYARAILEAFAEAYPASAQFSGGRRLRLGAWEKRIPETVDDVEAKDDFLSAAEALEKKKIVELKWRRFRTRTDLEAILLENPDLLYAQLERDSPETIRKRMLEVLDTGVRSNSDVSMTLVIDAISEYLFEEITEKRKVAISSVAEMRALMTLLSAPSGLIHALPLRALSIRLFGDSKRLEGVLPAFDAVSQRAVGEKLSDALGLSRSYPEVSVSLYGTILFHDTDRRRWRCRGEVFTLPASTVERFAGFKFLDAAHGGPLSFAKMRRRIDSNTIVTVENKESFYILSQKVSRARSTKESVIDEKDLRSIDAVVYTAGHPNPAVVAVLRTLTGAGAGIRHFGDMDPDGLLIPSEISRHAQAEVAPFLMNVDIYRRFLPFGYKLGNGATDRLRASRDEISSTFLPLCDAILECGVGVEQEVIDPEEFRSGANEDR